MSKSAFLETTHLTEIIEKSDHGPVIIFKYSNDCNSSARLYEEFHKEMKEKRLNTPMYVVTVQTQPVLSQNIEEWFDVKHETPQILILNKGKLTYSTHHNSIDFKKFVFK